MQFVFEVRSVPLNNIIRPGRGNFNFKSQLITGQHPNGKSMHNLYPYKSRVTLLIPRLAANSAERKERDALGTSSM
jgi:hypothetical protein